MLVNNRTNLPAFKAQIWYCLPMSGSKRQLIFSLLLSLLVHSIALFPYRKKVLKELDVYRSHMDLSKLSVRLKSPVFLTPGKKQSMPARQDLKVKTGEVPLNKLGKIDFNKVDQFDSSSLEEKSIPFNIDKYSFPLDLKQLEKSKISFFIKPPESFKANDFNDIEKVFYSFQKRVVESYIASFLRVYSEQESTHPKIIKSLNEGREVLIGNITFDGFGNIMRIKMLKWAQNDDIQFVFEETLKGIGKLPNPPKDLLSDNKLQIFYQLRINQL